MKKKNLLNSSITQFYCIASLGLYLLFFLTHSETVHASESKLHESPRVVARLVSEFSELKPGQKFSLGIWMKLAPGWHTYWRNPGDSGIPLALEWKLPKKFQHGPIQWPKPERISTPPLVTYGYHDEVLFPVEFTAPQKISANNNFTVTASWLVCEEICVPEDAIFEISIPAVSGARAAKLSSWNNYFQAFRENLLPEAPAASVKLKTDKKNLYVEINKILEPSDAADFLPELEGLLASGAPRFRESSASGLVLRMPLADTLQSIPDTLHGILISNGPHSKAYAIATELERIPAPTEITPADLRKTAPKFNLMILVFAFLGGMILNLMPCVFPVLAIKVLSFVKHGQSGRASSLHHGFAYSAGVVLSFVGLGLLLALLRSAGTEFGWGFQLQSPAFLYILVALLFAMSLNFLGAYDFSSRWMGIGGKLTSGDGLFSSFASGVLAVVVASPCTAPFMGTSIGVALAQPTAILVLLFSMLGVGMAFPYLLLASQPKLLRLLPKPGAWMVRFKELLAFPLLATCIWLLWVLSASIGSDGLVLAISGLLVLALGLWLFRSFTSSIGSILLFIALILSAYLGIKAPGALPKASESKEVASNSFWQVYSDSRLAELQEQGKIVFVNFTADWCITCKVNERAVIDSQEIRALFSANEVVSLKGDWTRRDKAIGEILARYGAAGVPLYLVFGPKQTEPQILPQILTKAIVANAIATAKK